MKGHRDDSRYQLDVGEPANHPGVSSFIELINFSVRQGNQTLGHHLKIVAAGICIYQKQHKIFF